MDTTVQKAYAPALACDSANRIWMAWIVFRASDKTTSLRVRHTDGDTWSDDTEIASTSSDILHPALAADHDGGVWIFWTDCRGGVWDVYARRLTAESTGDEINLTEHSAQDFAPAAATDAAGRVWLAWQSKRDGHFGVWLRHTDGDGWSPPLRVTEGRSNCWRPAIAADRDGGVWVAWDACCNRAYDVYLRHIAPGPSPRAAPERITTTRSNDMEAALAVDADGGVWVAWRRTAQWGRESYYLNADGQLCLRRYDPEERVLGLPALAHYTYRARAGDYGIVPVPVDLHRSELPVLPTLLIDAHGAIHLFCRRFRDHGLEEGYAWSVEHLVYSGNSWSELETVSIEKGYGSERIAAAMDREGEVWIAFQGCSWENIYGVGGQGYRHNPFGNAGVEPDSTVYVRRLEAAEANSERAACDTSTGTARVSVPPTSQEDLGVERTSGQTTRDGYTLIWGDMHRHSIYSSCKPYRDGSLEDHYRWAYDAGGLGFFVTADHIDDMNHYTWAQCISQGDLFNSEGDLVSLYGFEATYPGWGQANHYFIDRDISEIVKAAGLAETFEAGLELYDREGLAGRVFAARHYHGSTGTSGITDWHPDYEPLFEVVQTRGFCFGVMEGILSQGVRMGVNGGCDHSNPPGGVMPWIYANAITGVWVEAVSREAVFSALKARRTCATNGKHIEVYLEADRHPMGEEYTTSQPPQISIDAKATTRIERLELVRDGDVIFERSDCGPRANLTHTDNDAERGNHYYYVKLVEQEEAYDNYKGIAVTSPVWVRKT